jgi:hypothetical protein
MHQLSQNKSDNTLAKDAQVLGALKQESKADSEAPESQSTGSFGEQTGV